VEQQPLHNPPPQQLPANGPQDEEQQPLLDPQPQQLHGNGHQEEEQQPLLDHQYQQLHGNGPQEEEQQQQYLHLLHQLKNVGLLQQLANGELLQQLQQQQQLQQRGVQILQHLDDHILVVGPLSQPSTGTDHEEEGNLTNFHSNFDNLCFFSFSFSLLLTHRVKRQQSVIVNRCGSGIFIPDSDFLPIPDPLIQVLKKYRIPDPISFHLGSGF